MGLQGQVQCVGLLEGVDTRSVGWWRSSARSAVAREARFFVEFVLIVFEFSPCFAQFYFSDGVTTDQLTNFCGKRVIVTGEAGDEIQRTSHFKLNLLSSHVPDR